MECNLLNTRGCIKKFKRAVDRFEYQDPKFSRELKDGSPCMEDEDNAWVLSMLLKKFYEVTKQLHVHYMSL